jgi:methyl-accepting chemotaxis protein
MRLLNDLSVGKKLYAAFGLVLVLLVAVLAVSYNGIGSLASSTHHITHVSTPKLKTALALDIDASDADGWQSAYVMDHGASRGDFQDSMTQLRQDLGTLSRLSPDAQGQAAVARITAAANHYDAVDRQVFAAVRRGDTARANALALGRAQHASDALASAIDANTKMAERDLAASNASFKSTQSSTTSLMLVVGLVAILLAAGLAFLIARAIRRPLQRVQHAAETAAAGDLTVTVDVDGKDEVAQTAQAFQRMIASFREAVGQVTATSGLLAAASQQMASTSSEAGAAVAEIATAVTDMAQGAERQVTMTEASRQAAEEVTTSVRASAADAQATAEAAAEARSVAERGVSAADEASAAMSAVRGSTESVAGAMQQLSTKSEQIGEIVGTITAISSQTNLLALNAAIEAARAGEQGRGFAVVADEVRKLAEESQQAAATIADLVSEIQTDTRSTVDVVNESVERTESGSAVVEQAREAFVAIGSSVDAVSTRIDQIAAAAEQVANAASRMQAEIDDIAAVAEESSAATEQVSASVQQTSASTQQIAASAEELAQTAEELARLAAQFTIA